MTHLRLRKLLVDWGEVTFEAFFEGVFEEVYLLISLNQFTNEVSEDRIFRRRQNSQSRHAHLHQGEPSRFIEFRNLRKKRQDEFLCTWLQALPDGGEL